MEHFNTEKFEKGENAIMSISASSKLHLQYKIHELIFLPLTVGSQAKLPSN